MEKLNWKNLKDFACPYPACKKAPLHKLGDLYRCTREKCKFSIGETKFNAMVNDMHKPTQYDEPDRSDWV